MLLNEQHQVIGGRNRRGTQNKRFYEKKLIHFNGSLNVSGYEECSFRKTGER
jgi:hypothetical protein